MPKAVALLGSRCTFRDTLFRSIRSEEHTSELQSRENLVCRLLLEKKKITTHRRVQDSAGVSAPPFASSTPASRPSYVSRTPSSRPPSLFPPASRPPSASR